MTGAFAGKAVSLPWVANLEAFDLGLLVAILATGNCSLLENKADTEQNRAKGWRETDSGWEVLGPWIQLCLEHNRCSLNISRMNHPVINFRNGASTHKVPRQCLGRP